MATTISQIAEGLKTRLATIPNLRTFSSQPENITPPIGYPILDSVEYHGAFSGGDIITNWSIVVIVGRYTDSRAFASLDGYLSYDGATSIRLAIEGDRTLGGVAQSLVLSRGANIQPETQADEQFLMVTFDCRVHS